VNGKGAGAVSFVIFAAWWRGKSKRSPCNREGRSDRVNIHGWTVSGFRSESDNLIIMRLPSLLLRLPLVLTLLWLAGCATPDTRIQKAPEVFARLTPEQQELVRQGNVAVGFSQDAVRLAMGEPDRKWIRTDSVGTREVWSYTTWENIRGQPLLSGWYAAGGPFYYLNYPDRKEREYLKVIFNNDAQVMEVERTTSR
jgi:outer membrane protein assembly factor BamE (lipoprotein component of BamABCDE complex)